MLAFEDLCFLFTSTKCSRGIVRMDIAEAAFLYKMCKHVCSENDSKCIVEIGRKDGGSTLLMSANLKPSDEMYSIDIAPIRQKAKELIEEYAPNANVVTESSHKLGRKWTKPIDLLLIDGDHSFLGVRTDAKYWTKHIKPGGFCFMHDVITKKNELNEIIDSLLTKNFTKHKLVDSLLCLQKEKT